MKISLQTPVKIAVIGVGRLGRNHARWLAKIDSAELVGVFDTDSERAEEAARELSVPALVSIDQALEKVDAVCIATPTTTHHEVGMQALGAGVHALIEKPIAATMDEARDLVGLAEKKSLVLAVGHIERFNPGFLALAEAKVNPRFIEAHRMAQFGQRGLDVAVILDLMIHDIDLALKLVNSPVDSIQGSSASALTPHADIANVRIGFRNGAVANLTASRISLEPVRKMRIFQKGGYFSLDFSAKQVEIYGLSDTKPDTSSLNGDTIVPIPLGDSGRWLMRQTKSVRSDEDMLKMELEAFISAVAGEAKVAVSGAEATAALEVALEVVKTAESGSLIEQ